MMHWNHETNKEMSSVCRSPTRYLLANTIDIDVVQYAATTVATLQTWIAIVLSPAKDSKQQQQATWY